MVQELQRRQETLQLCFEKNQVVIKVNMNPLEVTASFLYLGLTIMYNNSDWVVFYRNMCKSQRRWGVVKKVLGEMG